MATALLIIWFSFVCGGLSYSIACPKGEGSLGFFVGALLGPLGIILTILSRGDETDAKQLEPRA